jgi:AcrR family transcriptional regulator
MTDTRYNILAKNYEAIRRHGFHSIRTDKVISELGITKGAFYHYFPSKTALGYAVIDEIIAPNYIDQWRQLNDFMGNPLDGIIQILELIKIEYDEEQVKFGCSLNNLIQEMAPLDDGFRARLSSIVEEMHKVLRGALERAANQLQLATLIDPVNVAYFILAALEGSFTLGKAMQSKVVFDRSIDQIIRYVRAMKR